MGLAVYWLWLLCLLSNGGNLMVLVVVVVGGCWKVFAQVSLRVFDMLSCFDVDFEGMEDWKLPSAH